MVDSGGRDLPVWWKLGKFEKSLFFFQPFGRVALIIALGAGLVLGCLATLLVLFYPLPSFEVSSSAFAKAMAGLKEWKEFLIALIAGCAIALGVVFMSGKKEAL